MKPFYTGGPSAITKDGHFLLTSMAQDLVITHVTSGILVDRIRGVSIITERERDRETEIGMR